MEGCRGLDPPAGGIMLTDWHSKTWKQGSSTPCAHPNFRFCAPTAQCPIIDPQWESEEGVPIDAIIFGGRRPEEKEVWKHHVIIVLNKKSIIGWLPEDGTIDTKSLSKVDMGALFDVPTPSWRNETKELRAYFTQQVGADLLAQVEAELKALEDIVHK